MHKIISAMEKKKKLKEMTVGDIIALPEFTKHMAEVINGEVFNHRQAEMEAITKGLRLQRTPYDSLKERDVLHADKMVEMWSAMLSKSLIGFSASERQYIDLIGLTAYKRTVIWLNEQEKKEKQT